MRSCPLPFLILCFIVVLCTSKCSSSFEPVVRLSLGQILGKNEDGYYSFHNIPYAEPPVGNRRFEAPIPYTQPWTGKRNGTGAITNCIKFGQLFLTPGSEDCLYVHVHTPSISCSGGQTHPVRVHIHGGGLMSGAPDDTDLSNLVKRGMVVVTMGYRLGALGFLSTADTVIPGNFGLKDQRLAIKWTKANIRSFCGDTNNIILSGVSAGGASTHHHLLQKDMENYVKAIISHSGVTTCPWAFEGHPKLVSEPFAAYLHCPLSSVAMKTCLQSKSIEELQAATHSLQLYTINQFTVFGAVVEPAGSQDAFLTEHPVQIMKNGKAANVTWLAAYDEREGSCNAAQFLALNADGSPEINILNQRWAELAPLLLFFEKNMTVQQGNTYSAFLRNKYLGDKNFSEANYRLLENMYTDLLFNNNIEEAIELHRKYCPGKVYVYLYKYPHNFGIGNLLSGRTDVSFGADHGADTTLSIPLFGLRQPTFTKRDKKLSTKMLDMYEILANTGEVKFDGKKLPSKKGRLTINEECYSIGCIDDRSPDCNCYKY